MRHVTQYISQRRYGKCNLEINAMAPDTAGTRAFALYGQRRGGGQCGTPFGLELGAESYLNFLCIISNSVSAQSIRKCKEVGQVIVQGVEDGGQVGVLLRAAG